METPSIFLTAVTYYKSYIGNNHHLDARRNVGSVVSFEWGFDCIGKNFLRCFTTVSSFIVLHPRRWNGCVNDYSG